MHKGLVVKKAAGQLIPEAALQQFLKNYPSCFGGAVAINDGTPEILTIEQGSPIPLETVVGIQNDYKDKDLVFFFGNYPEGVVNEQDVQPYSVVVDGDKPQVVGFFAGDYPGFHKEGSTHPDVWFAVNEDLRPTFHETFNDVCQKNLPKLLNTLKTPIIKRHMTNMIVGAGSVTLLAKTGEVITFSKNEGDIIPYSWGTTTDACGYVEAAAKPSVPASGRKLFSRPGDKKPAPAASPAPAAEPEKPAPGPAAAPSEPAPAPAAATANATAAAQTPPTLPEECVFVGVAQDGSILVKMKDMSGDKNHKRKWYMKYAGYQPDGYKKGVAVPLKKEFLSGTIKDLKDLKKAVEAPAPSAEPNTTATPTKINTPIKRAMSSGRKLYTSAKAAVLPEPAAEPAVGPASDLPKKDVTPHFVPDEVVMPFVSDTEKKQLELFIKTIDQDSSEIIDPKEFQDFESRCPNFTDLTGKNFTEPACWSDKKLAEFITNCPETVKVLLRNLMASNIGLHRSLEMLGRALTKTQDSQAKAA